MRSFSRRQGLRLGAAALLAPGAWAQSACPERGITLVDCFPAGGSTDLFARVA